MNQKSKDHVVFYVGPTGYGIPSRAYGTATLQPPAQRGSIKNLTNACNEPPGTIVLVDGRFGDVLAVGHKELLAAIDNGWQVWGLGSMGALRAAELAPYGMHGWGEVYDYLRGSPVPDDEVAVLHGPAPEYRPITEALVDLKRFLRHLVDDQVLIAEHAYEIVSRLANTWFGDRSLAALVDACHRAAGADSARAVSGYLTDYHRYRAKARDLKTFLQEQPWQDQKL